MTIMLLVAVILVPITIYCIKKKPNWLKEAEKEMEMIKREMEAEV